MLNLEPHSTLMKLFTLLLLDSKKPTRIGPSMTKLKDRYEQSSTNDGLVQKLSQHIAKIPSSTLHINLEASHNLSSVRSLAELLPMVATSWDIMHGKR